MIEMIMRDRFKLILLMSFKIIHKLMDLVLNMNPSSNANRYMKYCQKCSFLPFRKNLGQDTMKNNKDSITKYIEIRCLDRNPIAVKEQ